MSALKAAHPTGNAGDVYSVGTSDNNEIYIWDVDVSDWISVGSLKGPQGPIGPEGPKGEKGDPGAIQSINGKTATDLLLSAGDVGAYTKEEVDANATSKFYTITVPASGWTDGTLTFNGISCTKYNTVTVTGITADTRLSLGRYVSGSLDSCRSYVCQDTGAGTVTFWATSALAEFTVELVEVR